VFGCKSIPFKLTGKWHMIERDYDADAYIEREPEQKNLSVRLPGFQQHHLEKSTAQ
jgi:hypothetical protein